MKVAFRMFGKVRLNGLRSARSRNGLANVHGTFAERRQNTGNQGCQISHHRGSHIAWRVCPVWPKASSLNTVQKRKLMPKIVSVFSPFCFSLNSIQIWQKIQLIKFHLQSILYVYTLQAQMRRGCDAFSLPEGN